MSAGLLESARSVLAGLLSLGHTRFELFAVELREELRAVIEGALDGSVILGQIGQLADGDMPHRARGCPAQATSVAELIRALVVDLGV